MLKVVLKGGRNYFVADFIISLPIHLCCWSFFLSPTPDIMVIHCAGSSHYLESQSQMTLSGIMQLVQLQG